MPESRTIEGKRRSLNSYEADRIIRAWETFADPAERDYEPLHVYLGWTEAELLEYQILNILPISG